MATRQVSRLLVDCHCGDIVVDRRPRLERIYRTMRYRQVGMDIAYGVIVAEADPSNRWRVTARFPEGDRVLDTQWLLIELTDKPEVLR